MCCVSNNKALVGLGTPSYLAVFIYIISEMVSIHLAKSQVILVADLRYFVNLDSLFLFCIFLYYWMWYFIVYFKLYV